MVLKSNSPYKIQSLQNQTLLCFIKGKKEDKVQRDMVDVLKAGDIGLLISQSSAHLTVLPETRSAFVLSVLYIK